MANQKPTNEEIAKVLDQIADLLEAQEANPHRVRAYRRGASTVRQAEQPLAQLVEQEQFEQLKELPNIGDRLASLITELVHTGQSNLRQRLQGEVSPEALFCQVPGIGETLAQRIADALEVDTLEELEQAAHDGRLAGVEGFGPRRVEAVRATLAGMLSRAARRRGRRAAAAEREKPDQPAVATLLAVDAEYRRRAEAGDLKKIAPRRFNPEGKAWLPIMHTSRAGWHFTALYSNTARAHRFNKTHDWVVIYYDRDDTAEDQATVVTETSGPLQGKRVVRGREADCRHYYQSQPSG